ncbi:nicotinate-nucleotide-dimethylbenzimidazole phosphoribosyltransferase [Solimonas aquatica]|uniref:Nicotinate-nucleotide--dimethylbenzimidazole phosphoribosyltransferase n=1 Tax=Solimonas aquatica TaxID=489703 RepID=A0A1H8ZVC8_9GAMM|nr:nicotinate-nucleotide--dimethylbenzimidazole phosphoribosyltransferase [Solimonas aquatica]SEP68285.1 nicotinate-nucleotide-dimethylbenzimidazole phosphoribosyltransferase [Solimonas aquatica]
MNAPLRWLHHAVAAPSAALREQARAHQAQLTKPAGALGLLEDLVIELAAMQHCLRPTLERVQISIFAADHGVAAENVSAFPQAVTAQMVDNFARGGAAISVLATELDAHFEVIDLGTMLPSAPHARVRRERIAAGTANFAQDAAMSAAQLASALGSGHAAVQRARAQQAQLFIGGEMGIANTTSASALACLLLDAEPQALVGRGTGLDDAGLAHKISVIGHALDRHRPHCGTPLEALARVGGFEIAALCGAYIAAAQAGLPVLVDGFICSAAALAACRLQPGVRDWLLFSHCGAEAGHARLLEALRARGLLDLQLRLGEGSGAALALPLLRLACRLHANMASFAQAGVSGRD